MNSETWTKARDAIAAAFGRKMSEKDEKFFVDNLAVISDELFNEATKRLLMRETCPKNLLFYVCYY